MNSLSKRLMSVMFVCLMPAGVVNAEEVRLTGAGASFPYPVYSQWANKYHKLTGMKLNYQSIGSGGGIAQIKAKTVNFGASDAPMEPADLKKHGLLQFPMVIGGVVPVVNIKGIAGGQVKLTPQALADIYLGKIKKWNDPALTKINAGVNLPDGNITVVHRADGSGTSWIFTNYLSKVSSEWKTKIGCGKRPAWPTGRGGKGNEGVAQTVKQIDGSIGYVEYAYALQNKLSHVLLQNQAGEFVAPSGTSFQAAAANADWIKTPGMAVVLTDQPGKDTWPISGASFILIYRIQGDAAKAATMLKFFDWCYGHGGEMAEKLHYVPMPKNVADMIRDIWRKEVGLVLSW